jgi:DHA2 family multidrug resistance protein
MGPAALMRWREASRKMSQVEAELRPARAGASYAIVTVSVMAATVMQSLDTTIANVALPHMQGALSGSQEQMGWVLTSYIVAAAIMIPLTGWLANIVGKRKILLASVLLFTAASLLCAVAANLPQMVFYRFLQGVGGAALVPLSQAVLLDINEPAKFGRAMAMWAGAAQLGNIVGPALGGWLTEDLSWRWVFYINLPIGALAFIGLLRFAERPTSKSRSRFDVMGFAALSLAITALQVMLDRGQLLDWFSSTEIRVEALVAGISFYVFLVHTFTTDKPFVNPGLFKDANYVASIVFIFLIGVVLFATLALLPPLLTDEFDYPVVLTGLVIAPRGVGTVVGMLLVNRLMAWSNVRVVIASGLLIMAFSLWQMTQFSPDMNYGPVIASGLAQGFGVSLVYVPLSTVAFSSLADNLRNEGTSLFSLMRNIGSSAGISVVDFMLTRNTQTVHASLVELVRLPGGEAAAAAVAASDPFAPKGLAEWNELINHQSAFIAYLDDFRMMMILTLATLPAVLILRGGRAATCGHAFFLFFRRRA